MIKLVYAEGCSITSGAEHRDWYMSNQGLECSETTWTAQVQQRCFPDAKYFSSARSASSNSHIRRRAIHFLSQMLQEHQGNEIVFLVQWTDINRKEVRVPTIQNTKNYQVFIDKDESLYTTILPIDLPGVEEFSNPIANQKHRNDWLRTNKILDFYNEYNMHVVSKEVSMYDTLAEIETVRNFCRLHGIKLYETCGFGELVGHYGPLKTEDKFLIELVDRVNPTKTIFHIKDVNPEGIWDWAIRVNLPLGPGRHPLEGAHRTWAKMFIDHYKLKKVKND